MNEQEPLIEGVPLSVFEKKNATFTHQFHMVLKPLLRHIYVTPLQQQQIEDFIENVIANNCAEVANQKFILNFENIQFIDGECCVTGN